MRPAFTYATLAFVAVVAACATIEHGTPGTDPNQVIVPDEDAGLDAELPLDGGCDASEPDCVTVPITCEEAAWCPVPTQVSPFFALTAVWGSGPNDVWAAGSGGTVIRWNGAAWTPVPGVDVKNTFHTIWGSGPSDVWIASATDVIYHFDGTSLTRVPPPQTLYDVPVYSVWGFGPDHVRFGTHWVTAEDEEGNIQTCNQHVRITSDGGASWKSVPGTPNARGMWGASPDDLWLIGDNTLWVDWQVNVALHGTRAPGETEHTWTSVDTQAAVFLRAIWGSSAGDVWAVGDKGTIRHWVANAIEWEIVPSPTTESLHAVFGFGPNDVWAVGESGAILHYDGTAWTESVAAFPVNKKKPNLYGVWGSSPDDVWIVGDGIALRHGGGS